MSGLSCHAVHCRQRHNFRRCYWSWWQWCGSRNCRCTYSNLPWDLHDYFHREWSDRRSPAGICILPRTQCTALYCAHRCDHSARRGTRAHNWTWTRNFSTATSSAPPYCSHCYHNTTADAPRSPSYSLRLSLGGMPEVLPLCRPPLLPRLFCSLHSCQRPARNREFIRCCTSYHQCEEFNSLLMFHFSFSLFHRF